MPPSPPPPPITVVTELGVIDPMYGTQSSMHGGPQQQNSISAIASIYSPPPPAGEGGPFPDGMVQGGGFLALGAVLYMYASSRGLLPWSKSKGEIIPQAPMDAAKLVRAKPKKVDVQVEQGGELASTIEVTTKGLTTVSELGERLAEQMVTELDIEDSFKLYYIDNEGDTMLVSAHTGLRDLLYSECITAKVDLLLPEPPPEPPKETALEREERKDREREKKKKKKGPSHHQAPVWD